MFSGERQGVAEKPLPVSTEQVPWPFVPAISQIIRNLPVLWPGTVQPR